MQILRIRGGEKINKQARISIVMVFAGILLATALVSGLVSAKPDSTVKVNGSVFSTQFYFDGPYANPREGNPAHIEAKATWVNGQLVGSGSFHGINCHVTLFYDLTGTIHSGKLTLSGTVTSTNTPYEGYIGVPIQIITDLSGDNMQLIVGGSTYFNGAGTVVL